MLAEVGSTLPPLEVEREEASLAGLSPEAPSNWLLIGPLARECAHWGDALPSLLAHLQLVQPKARLFQMDLPGTGHLCEQLSPADVGGLVAAMRRRVAAGEVSGPWGLIASSWSATLAVEWSRIAPGEVGCVVLLSPALRPFTRVLRSVRPALWSQAAAKVLGRALPPGNTERARALLEAHPVRTRTGLAHLLAVWRYSSSRRRPHQRVLLLAGKGDDWMDWRVSAAISRAWGAALRLHPEAGHDLLHDDAQWVGRAVAEWLMPVGSGALDAPPSAL